MKKSIENEKIEETLSGNTPEELENELEIQGINNDQEPSDKRGITYNNDGYGQRYEIKGELREKFPNSYFYLDFYDESICGVNFLTGSIIYDLKHLGFLHTVHVEGHFGNLKDRLECGSIVSNRIQHLTPKELEGKVPPIVIFDDKYMDDWNHYQGYVGFPLGHD